MQVFVITGSRGWTDIGAIFDVLAELRDRTQMQVVRHGGARGVDDMAETCAQMLGYVVDRMPADWDRWGRRAGYMRNEAMLTKDPLPDRVLAFWDGQSRGTKHCMEMAERLGIPLRLTTPTVECDA